MSFKTDVDVSVILKRPNDERLCASQLLTFFKKFADCEAKYAKDLQKAAQGARGGLACSFHSGTMKEGYESIFDSILDSAQRHGDFANTITDNVTKPLQEWSKARETENRQLTTALNQIATKIKGAKSKIEMAKNGYFSRAKAADKENAAYQAAMGTKKESKAEKSYQKSQAAHLAALKNYQTVLADQNKTKLAAENEELPGKLAQLQESDLVAQEFLKKFLVDVQSMVGLHLEMLADGFKGSEEVVNAIDPKQSQEQFVQDHPRNAETDGAVTFQVYETTNPTFDYGDAVPGSSAPPAAAPPASAPPAAVPAAAPPSYDAPPPSYDAPPPSYDAPPPSYDAAPPAYDASPSAAPPSYASAPPGSPPPSYDAPPSGAPPAYDTAPSGGSGESKDKKKKSSKVACQGCGAKGKVGKFCEGCGQKITG